MRGKKTSMTDPSKQIVKILGKNGIDNFSCGIIIPVRGRSDHRVTVKHQELSGAHLLSITGKKYKQEIRFYDNVSREVILQILKESLNESFRIL